MNFLFYGAGALGQALGCMLAQKGHNVDLLLRRRFIDTIRLSGLSVDGVMGNYAVSADKLGLLESVEQAEKSYDYVILTTKTYDTAKAVEEIASLQRRAGIIVSMQNGCGNLELLQDRFGEEVCLGARVITGFEITRPGQVHISVTADAIHIGGTGCCTTGEKISPAASHLARAIDDSGHPCIAVTDINVSLFAKLLYNCALNPLGAVLGVHYGALAESDQTKSVMNKIIDETFAVIEAMGGRTPWQTADEYKEIFYQKLVPATYNHRASMLQDLENSKPTEVDSLVGYVSNMGKEHGVNTDACDLLAAMVRFKEDQAQLK